MEFKNATISKKANVYFDGKVVSYTVKCEDGTTKTLGVMQAGDYTFNTGAAEVMEFLSGELSVELPNQTEPLVIHEKATFDVPANSSFTLHVKTVATYCCAYAN